jgi:hypothetical protein
MASLYRAEISPGSVTVLAWYPNGNPVVRLLNGRPMSPVQTDGLSVR